MSEPSASPAVEARDLELARGGAPVLLGMSLRIEPGEFVALVGPSGCGKSTLLSVLAGLVGCDAGQVLLDGRPAPDRLGALTLMPQSDALMPWRTVLENVRIAARLAGEPPGRAEELARAALTRVGLGGAEDLYPHALSGGMRQRAALARTLLSRGGAWLLDEPLGALDALTRSDLRGLLAETWALRRPTTLLVTHDLEEALLLADRVLVCSPRPARILSEVVVPLARPRRLDDTLGPEYVSLRAALLDALRLAGALA